MTHFRSSHQALRRLLGQHQNPSADRITNSLLFTAQGLRFRKLEVILTTNIDKLGKAGDTVKVAPGYFRNYLMPKLLAVPNIDKFVYLVQEQRKLYQREEEEAVQEVSKEKEEIPETSLDDTGLPKVDKMKEYQTAAIRLHNGCLGLRRLIKVDNELRTPVTKEELVAEVARQLGVCIYPENLHLPGPLTTVGQYEVPLRLPREIPRPEGTLMWTLKVNVRRKRSGNETIFKSPSSDQAVPEAVPTEFPFSFHQRMPERIFRRELHPCKRSYFFFFLLAWRWESLFPQRNYCSNIFVKLI